MQATLCSLFTVRNRKGEHNLVDVGVRARVGNVKKALKCVRCVSIEWIHLADDRDCWCAVGWGWRLGLGLAGFLG